MVTIPGSVFSDEDRGANKFIQKGVKLVNGIEDILTTCFPSHNFTHEEKVELDGEDKYIYALVDFKKVHIDEIIEKRGMEAKKISAILTGLEMKEAVRQIPGGYYIKTACS